MINSTIGSLAARITLLIFWAAGFGTVFIYRSLEMAAAELLVAGILLTAAVVLTRVGADPISRRAACAVGLLTVGAAALMTADVLVTNEGGRVLGWAVEYAAYLGGLVAVRGRRVLGSATVLACAILLLIAWWAVGSSAGVTLGAFLPSLGILAVALVWGTILPRGRRTIAALRRDREKERHSESVARDSAALQDARIAHVVSLAEPQLRAVAGGRDLTPDEVSEVRAIEGDIRDTLTAPALRSEAVRAAIHRARRRGVDVSVIDLRQGARDLPSAAVELIADVVDEVGTGRVALKLEEARDDNSIGSVVAIQHGVSTRHPIPG